jgi:hypothetical protein
VNEESLPARRLPNNITAPSISERSVGGSYPSDNEIYAEHEAWLERHRALKNGEVPRSLEIRSTTKENTVVESKPEGSLTLPFGPFSLSEEEQEPPWVWGGFITPGSLTLLSGWPKVGKTSLIFGLLAALERGEAFLGLPTRSVGVLLLTEERKGTLDGKVRRWNLNGDFRHLRRQQAKDESWPEIVRQAVFYSCEHDLQLLTVDTLAEWAQIQNENDAGEVLAAMRPLQEAAASAGLAVLVGSHGRKAPGRHGEAVRGSNAMTAQSTL